METRYTIDVSTLDTAHRHAIEQVIGVPLHANHRLTIDVTELPDESHRSGTTLEEWTSVYDGLTEEQIEEQIEEIDQIINLRANRNRTM